MTIPAELLNSLKDLPGLDEAAFIEAHREENRITSLRLNPFKPVTLDFETGKPVAWCKEGYYLDQRPSFTQDPLFHAGCYYVQEAGSMFIEFALRHSVDLSRDMNVLDLCAAPGGKSTLINSLISKHSLLISNETVKNRAGILAMNLSKWGQANVVVCNNDAAQMGALEGFFDVMVVDAPCSGSGLFRKQPEAIAEWSEKAVLACAERQGSILEDSLPGLKEGGILIYSTCSYSPAENEAVVERLIQEAGMEYVALPVPRDWGLVDSGRGYRFYPHLTQSEGFFCAVLRKKGESGQTGSRWKKPLTLSANERQTWEPLLSGEGLDLMKKNDRYYALNERAMAFVGANEKRLYFKKAGLCLGEVKGKDLVPDQELAWASALAEDLYRVDLNYEQALAYLKKEKVNGLEAKQGLCLMTYKGQGLGWAKCLPGRMNNYYPQEYRVLK